MSDVQRVEHAKTLRGSIRVPGSKSFVAPGTDDQRSRERHEFHQRTLGE